VPQPDADLARQRDVVDAFLAASRAGDFDALLAVLDPSVVFRAAGVPELQQERRGADDVARTFATFGPGLATRCRPAIVNGHAGLVIQAPDGPLGAIGFLISAALITTIDFTVDPGKVEAFESLLVGLRGGPASRAERIINEALSWPGVHRDQGHLGSIVLRVGRRELGHLHGDAVADVPALEPEGHSEGWVKVPLATEEGAQRALGLLRANYEGEQPSAC
jgi:hypothetical protein